MKKPGSVLKKLSVRVAAIIILVSIVCAGAAIAVSYRSFTDMSDDFFKETAENIAETAVMLIDGDIIGEYAFDREQDEEYQKMYDLLSEVRECNDVLYLYVEHIEGNDAIAVLDTDQENPMGFREVFPVSDGVDLSKPDEIPATIVCDESSGFITVCSVFKPVRNSQGEVTALVGVDISVQEMVQRRHDFLIRVSIILAILSILLIIIFAYSTDKTVVKPIKQLSKAARNFVDKDAVSHDDNIDKLQINSADEINDLHASIIKMEHDIRDYIENLTAVMAEKERIGAELNVAKEIQESMLPAIVPPYSDCDRFNIWASMSPAKEVGGDFYDFFMIDDDHIGLVIADVSGKGVPAAMFMMISMTLIKSQCMSGGTPAEILEKVNNQLCENNSAEMFVTVWLGIFDMNTGVLTATNAGHEYPAIKKADGKFELLKDKHGFVVAGMSGVKYKNYELQLEPGDKIFVYTDGVAEATNAQDELFGTDRMLEALNSDPTAAKKALIDNVQNAIDDFVKDAPQFDDITMLSFLYKGNKQV